jgi:hypothetical protein
MELGKEQSHAFAERGDVIALGVWDADDQAMQSQPAQIVGHAPRRIGFERYAEQLGDMAAQCGIAEALGQQNEQAQRLKQGHDPGIAERQRRGTLAVNDTGTVDLLEDRLGEVAVLADALDLEHATVGGKADGPQRGQIAQASAEAEVAGVVDGGFGPQRAFLLEVLLDARGLVVDVQRRGDVVGDDAGAKTPWGAPGDTPIEDQADLLGAAEVEVLADDLLEQMPSAERTVKASLRWPFSKCTIATPPRLANACTAAAKSRVIGAISVVEATAAPRCPLKNPTTPPPVCKRGW